MIDKNKSTYENIIAGRNPISEALKSNREINYILIGHGNNSGSILTIVAMAKNKGIPIKECNPKKLDLMCPYAPHQGIIAVVASYKYSKLENIFKLSKSRGEDPLIIIANEIEDPHNLGAIIRSAECVGAHGIIIPKRRSSSLTYVVSRASAGAIEYIPIVRVANIASTLNELKKRGIWIYGADMEGQSCYNTDLTGPIALVIGNEGKGISRLIKKKCDIILSLPLKGNISSLNASVAAGVLMYEILRQKSQIKNLGTGGNNCGYK